MVMEGVDLCEFSCIEVTRNWDVDTDNYHLSIYMFDVYNCTTVPVTTYTIRWKWMKTIW